VSAGNEFDITNRLGTGTLTGRGSADDIDQGPQTIVRNFGGGQRHFKARREHIGGHIDVNDLFRRESSPETPPPRPPSLKEKDVKTITAHGAFAGAAAGVAGVGAGALGSAALAAKLALVGGAIGTAIFPGAGTVAGAVIGGLIGAIAGGAVGAAIGAGVGYIVGKVRAKMNPYPEHMHVPTWMREERPNAQKISDDTSSVLSSDTSSTANTWDGSDVLNESVTEQAIPKQNPEKSPSPEYMKLNDDTDGTDGSNLSEEEIDEN
jgi:hypothetical protein